MRPVKIGKRILAVIVLTVMFSFLLLHMVQAVTTAPAEPGTDGDPLVTQSYVDSKAVFTVVKLTAGQQLIAEEGSEIVVRSGKATAISGQNGDGLADVTTDNVKLSNLYTGNIIPSNHLLVVSRTDGRGLKAVSSEVYILIKGTYTIK